MIFKKILWLPLCTIGLLFINASVSADSYLEKAAKIRLLGKYSGKENGWIFKEDAKEYFREFPSNFSDFVDLFGYKEAIGEDRDGMRRSTEPAFGVLYENSYKYISLYFSASEFIEREEFIEKSLRLSIGGYWQSDAVSIFRHELERDIKKSKAEYAGIMTNYSEGDLNSILKFLADNNKCCADPLDISWIVEEICVLDKTKSICEKTKVIPDSTSVE